MDRIDREYDSEKTDLFQSMMEAKDPKRGQEFGLKELWIESMLLLIAGVSQRNLSADNGVTPHILTAPGGSDSTSTAMAATFFYLAHHSSALDQVVTELKAAFAERDDIVSGTKLDSCKYLQACLNEAMRLVPSVPNVLPRYVLPGGIAVDGEYLPEGTIVGCCQYALNRHPDYFTEPNSFRPERWLCDERNTIGDVELARRAFSPFSTGP